MKAIKTAAALLAALVAPALAQQSGHLDVTTTVQKEVVTVNESGETESRLVPAETVVPGEKVVYTITFRNVSTDGADNVVITNPISEALAYVEGSAFGPGSEIEFSIDGGVTFARPEDLTVTEDGEVRRARPEEFTHIRWVMDNTLAAGAQGMARFAAVLE